MKKSKVYGVENTENALSYLIDRKGFEKYFLSRDWNKVSTFYVHFLGKRLRKQMQI